MNHKKSINDQQEQSWELLDPKVENKLDGLLNKLNQKDDEITLLKTEIQNLKKDLVSVKEIFQDWKEDLVKSRLERLKVLLDIKTMLKENRSLYMQEFNSEKSQLNEINKKHEELKKQFGSDFQLRNVNRVWRSGTVIQPNTKPIFRTPSNFMNNNNIK